MSISNEQIKKLIEKYNVDYVVYGHLHGYKNISTYFVKNNIPYFLTSCDEVDNNLIFIADI